MTCSQASLYPAALHHRYSKLGLKFQMYTDKELRNNPDCDLSHVNFLIISPESLCLIKALRPKYSCVIADEIESILAQYSSSTMTKLHTRQPASWSAFMRVCVNADKVLFLDGHASNRSVSTLQAICDMKKAQESNAQPLPSSTSSSSSSSSVNTLQACYERKQAQDSTAKPSPASTSSSSSTAPESSVKPLAFIRNTYVVHKREAVMLHSSTAGGKSADCKKAFVGRVIKDLEAGKKVFVFSDTATFAHQLHDTLATMKPELVDKIILYSAHKGDEHNDSVRYAETEWVKYVCVIYSPVITVSGWSLCSVACNYHCDRQPSSSTMVISQPPCQPAVAPLGTQHKEERQECGSKPCSAACMLCSPPSQPDSPCFTAASIPFIRLHSLFDMQMPTICVDIVGVFARRWALTLTSHTLTGATCSLPTRRATPAW
jgi:hypothetical protein